MIPKFLYRLQYRHSDNLVFLVLHLNHSPAGRILNKRLIVDGCGLL